MSANGTCKDAKLWHFKQIRSPSLVTVLSLALLTCLSLQPCASFKKQGIFGVYNASSKVTQTAEFSPQTKEELKLNIDACLSSSPKPSEDRATASSKVTALELAIAYAPEDLPPKYSDRYSGFKYSGSFAGRNIEKIHALGGLDGSLEAAVTTVFETRAVEHVLICSGFYVVHSMGSKDGSTPGMAPGSCETDGPLGALAVLRAFAARGVRVSLYCDPHNGAVMRAGYEAMLKHYDTASPPMANRLRTHTRCLHDGNGDGGWPTTPDVIFLKTYAETFPQEKSPSTMDSLRSRSLMTAMALRDAMVSAWGRGVVIPVDCLFAIERLGCPYRNVRGADISEHTEPIDALWPLYEQAPPVQAYASEHGIHASDTLALRAIAGVTPDAITLAVGDGGNEVGFAKVAMKEEISQLTPGGEFAPLSVNGCYRDCHHLIAATVSNWGGTAFEAAAHLLYGHSALHYLGPDPAVVEKKIIDAIVEAGSVDGKHPSLPMSVDGMSWDPHHRQFYEMLWDIAR